MAWKAIEVKWGLDGQLLIEPYKSEMHGVQTQTFTLALGQVESHDAKANTQKRMKQRK